MAKETRFIFGLEDILQIRVICLKCKGEITRSLSQRTRDLPEQCPTCLDEWWEQIRKPAVIGATMEALRSLHQLSEALKMDNDAHYSPLRDRGGGFSVAVAGFRLAPE